jgi:hypothetical protein
MKIIESVVCCFIGRHCKWLGSRAGTTTCLPRLAKLGESGWPFLGLHRVIVLFVMSVLVVRAPSVNRDGREKRLLYRST